MIKLSIENIINTSNTKVSCVSCGYTTTVPYTQIINQNDPPTCSICMHIFPTMYKEELIQIISKVIADLNLEKNWIYDS